MFCIPLGLLKLSQWDGKPCCWACFRQWTAIPTAGCFQTDDSVRERGSSLGHESETPKRQMGFFKMVIYIYVYICIPWRSLTTKEMSSIFVIWDMDMDVFMQKQWTKFNSLPPLRSKTHGSLSLSHPFDVTNITFTHWPGLHMFRHIRLQLKHFSFKGRNQWSGAFVCGGAAIQTAPSRTLWCYFNIGSCNCVEQACFFPAGQTEDSTHCRHPIPGQPSEVALVWDLFEVPPAERTSLKKHWWTPQGQGVQEPGAAVC